MQRTLFELVWSNLIGQWHATCPCGVDFGSASRVAMLAEEFDEHIDYDDEEAGVLELQPTMGGQLS
jgi:hypothetical protein